MNGDSDYLTDRLLSLIHLVGRFLSPNELATEDLSPVQFFEQTFIDVLFKKL